MGVNLAHVPLEQVSHFLVVDLEMPDHLAVEPPLEGVAQSRLEHRHNRGDDDAGRDVAYPGPD